MKRWLFYLVLIILLAVAVRWTWQHFFPGTQTIISRQMMHLAKLASFTANETEETGRANVSALMELFSPDVEININTPDLGEEFFTGRERLEEELGTLRAQLPSLKVQFLDAVVKLAADKQTAIVDLTMRASRPGDRDFLVEQLKFTVRLSGERWLITRVETIRTLN